MKKPKFANRPRGMRTVLFVPGHIEKMLTRAARLNADCIALCLEDAVPAEHKEHARQMVRSMLKADQFNHAPVFVRVNALDSGLTLQDLEATACRQLDGFVYPMANWAADIQNFDAQLRLMEAHLQLEKGHFSIVALVETPLAVLNAYEIAKASTRVIALMFGCEDYMAEMESRYSEDNRSLFVPRGMVAMAAHAAGIEAVDTPYVRVHDLTGLKRFATLGRDLGMTGMLVLTPQQIKVARACYTPGPEEISYAKDVVQAAAAARKGGKGVAVVKGKFISPPTLKQAQKLLARWDRIKQREALTEQLCQIKKS